MRETLGGWACRKVTGMEPQKDVFCPLPFCLHPSILYFLPSTRWATLFCHALPPQCSVGNSRGTPSPNTTNTPWLRELYFQHMELGRHIWATVIGSHESMRINIKVRSCNEESTSFQNYKILTRKRSINVPSKKATGTVLITWPRWAHLIRCKTRQNQPLSEDTRSSISSWMARLPGMQSAKKVKLNQRDSTQQQAWVFKTQIHENQECTKALDGCKERVKWVGMVLYWKLGRL